MKRLPRVLPALALLLSMPLLGGARGDGCAASSTSPAPDVTGTWDVTYDDVLGVKINIGGQEFDDEVPAGGGQVTITYQGQPITFDLDCARPEVVCPSEAWPRTVTAEQRDQNHEHQMIVTLPTQVCEGTLRPADPSECGDGTINPDCEDVCDGDVVTQAQEKFGVIGESGNSFRLYLGAGVASNGLNCALLGVSLADADLVTSGRGTPDWQATDMTDGLVTTAYAGGCLWLQQSDMDPDLEAQVLGASVTFTTGFTATRE